MFTLAATDTLQGKAGTAAAITYTITGDRKTTVDNFEKIGTQGQLGTSVAALYTVPASTSVMVKEVMLANTTGSSVSGIVLYISGTATTNQVTGTFSIPANGTAIYTGEDLRIFASDGLLLTTIGGAAGGDLTGSYPNPTINPTALSAYFLKDQGILVGHATVAGVAGMLYWDTTENVLKFTDSDTTRALSIGHEDWIDAKNVTGSTIGNGVPVYINGANTASPTIALAKADAQATAVLAGVTTQSIANNATGKVTRFGIIHGMDTSAFTAGATVYLSATTAGALTATAPTGSNIVAKVGTVLTSNASTGQLLVTLDAILPDSSATQRGAMSALDKKKSDNLYYDVTTWDTTGANNLVGDDSTDNASKWTALFAVLPVGARVYFPPGTYRTSAAFAITADKHLTIFGGGKYASIIKTTSTTADGFSISGGQYWYNSFSDLRFETTMLNKTAGAAILISTSGLGANAQQVGINIYRCSFSNWFKAIYAIADATNGASQGPGNLSIWDSLDISITGTTGPVNSRGIHINGAGTNLVISNSTINMGYPPFQVTGTAAIEINASGAIQMVNGEFIGGTNTLLLSADGSTGTNNSVAAVYATNSFFDQSAGSTVKIAGANIVNRCKFVQCGITTGSGAVAGYIAAEVASTGTGAAGGGQAKADGIDFFDCDIYANGGTNPIGFSITGAQGVTINNCRISGGGTALTTGIAVTPTVSNGYTKIIITGNKIGTTNNFTSGVTTGINLAAGSFQYGVVQITDNDLTGSVTPLVDASTIGPTHFKNISPNIGLSPANLPALASGGGSLLANNGRGAITSTIVETFLCTFRVPANGTQVGDIVHIQALVQGNGTGTNFTPRIRVGAAGTIADAAVLINGTLNTGVANSWHIVNAYVYVVALGPTATVYATLATQGTSASSAAAAAAEAPGNVPTTAAWFITFTGQSAANGHLIRSIRARFI